MSLDEISRPPAKEPREQHQTALHTPNHFNSHCSTCRWRTSRTGLNGRSIECRISGRTPHLLNHNLHFTTILS